MKTDYNGTPTTRRAELIKAVKSIPNVPDYDVMMHVEAILDGAYSLLSLMDNAKHWYAPAWIGNDDRQDVFI